MNEKILKIQTDHGDLELTYGELFLNEIRNHYRMSNDDFVSDFLIKNYVLEQLSKQISNIPEEKK